MPLQTWSDVLATSFMNLWVGVISYVPNILVSIIIFVVGWVVGVVVGGWVSQLIKSLKLDTFLQTLGINEVINRAGYRLDSGAFLGALVKWFFILAFLIAALDVLGLQQVTVFLENVLAYLPNVFVAVLILIVAAVVADALKNIVTASARAAEIGSADLFGGIVKWAVWVFAFLVALSHLGVAGPFAQTIFTGLIAMLAIAGGLAFGLGGQGAAGDFIDKLRSDIRGKK
jgi:small-conductance mechanosensitive channel